MVRERNELFVPVCRCPVRFRHLTEQLSFVASLSQYPDHRQRIVGEDELCPPRPAGELKSVAVQLHLADFHEFSENEKRGLDLPGVEFFTKGSEPALRLFKWGANLRNRGPDTVGLRALGTCIRD